MMEILPLIKKIMNRKDLAKHKFSDDGAYPCPVCHHGQISAMPLMEALACNFCRHIFTLDAVTQHLTMADSSLALTWRWNGRGWRSVYQNDTAIGWGIVLGALAFVLLPTTLVALSAYIFPAEPQTFLSWLPLFWIGLTFVCHLLMVVSIAIESYQFPVFAYLNALKRNFLRN